MPGRISDLRYSREAVSNLTALITSSSACLPTDQNTITACVNSRQVGISAAETFPTVNRSHDPISIVATTALRFQGARHLARLDASTVIFVVFDNTTGATSMVYLNTQTIARP